MFNKLKNFFIGLWSAVSSSRLWWLYCLVLTAALAALLCWFAPVQIPVAIYKVCLALGARLAGYWLDRAIWPYAHPAGYLADDWRKEPDADNQDNADYPIVNEYRWPFIAAMLRQALVVCVAMGAVCLGL